jgi:uncharacterized protein YbaA (DUF1428 family)
MAYVEGFVVPVPAAKRDEYRSHAAEAEPLFKSYGATRLVEAWGDDVPDGKLNDLKGAVQAKDDEVVVFSWIEFPTKEARDSGMEKMLADPKMKDLGANMPFDAQRMIFGSFDLLVEEKDGTAGSMGYADGMLVAVPAERKDDYREFAEHTSALFRECGAIRVVDTWEDNVPDGKITDFKRAVLAEDGEKVVFAWIEWPSKDVRDQAWQRITQDPRMREVKAPFDGKRMIFGGFRPLLDA